MEKGDRIKWTYTHWLNSKSTTQITKIGTFIRHVKRKKKFLADWDASPMCIVKFDKNKGYSKVRISEITKNK